MLSDILYSVDTEGRMRTWQYQLNQADGQYRTITGLRDGKKTVSGWTTCPPKSQKTKALQAAFEANASFTKKVKTGWHLTEEGALNSDFVEPMLAQTFKEWKQPVPDQEKTRCFGQAKLDGVRMMMYRNGLWTRTGEPIISVPHIQTELSDLMDYDPSFRLDGELYNHELHDELDKISGLSRLKVIDSGTLEKTRILQYHVYDCPSLSGDYPQRHAALTEAIRAIGSDHIRIVPYTELFDEDGFIEYTEKNLELKYEGTMLRYGGYGYEYGKRSKSLEKVKPFITEEFILVDIEEGNGNWSGRAKRAIVRLSDGQLCEAGIRGDFAFAEKLLREKHLYIGGEVTVRFFRYTKDGKLNLPVVIDFGRHGR